MGIEADLRTWISRPTDPSDRPEVEVLLASSLMVLPSSFIVLYVISGGQGKVVVGGVTVPV